MQIVKHVLVDEEKRDLGKNFLFSPLSLTTLLSMVASGLKGDALEKMMSLLGLKSLADIFTESSRAMSFSSSEKANGPVLFSSVNGAWLDHKYTLKPSFQHALKSIFNAHSSTLDFTNQPEDSIDEINKWVENATKGLIKKSLSKDVLKVEETVLILANALYFKGSWQYPFFPPATKCDNFYTLDGDTVQVPYMNKDCRVFDYGSFEGFKILRMPYKCSSGKIKHMFAMYFFLPHEKDGLHSLLEQLSTDSALLNLRFEFEEVRIRELKIPKFKFKYNLGVSEIMEQMGLRVNIKSDAEMLEALDANSVIEDMKVCHTSFIEVNEHGTEAAAVTFSLVGGGAPPPTVFVADHPFVFMIREDSSETPIFIGTVVNPLLE